MGQVVCMTFGLIQSKCQASRGLYHEDETVTIHLLLLAGDEIWMFKVLSSRLLGNFPVKRYIFEAICTTAKARIHFYRQGILMLQNFRVLNMGTGSPIYTLSPGKASLPRGKYLGQFKDELEMRS